MNARRRVTSYDVAAAAGVSRTTVSFVLNNTPNQSIPDGTRRAVKEAARGLGYTPSAAAKTLRAGSSRLVLCITADWEPSSLMDEGLALLTKNLRDAGYATVIAKSAEDPESLDILWQSISPAAVVAMFDLPPDVRRRTEAMKVPLVEAFFHSFGSRDDPDNVQIDAGALQAEYVISRGATRIAYVAPPTVRDAGVLSDRLRGATSAATARDLPAPRFIEVSNANEVDETAIRDIVDGYDQNRLAVCCYNDDTALRVITSARRIGLEVPRDFSVIGVDDLAMSAIVVPGITSVRFDIPAHMARVAARIKAALLVAEDDEAQQRPFSYVVPRESA